MEKIVIKNRLTGEVSHELPSDLYLLSRAPSKQRKRRSGIFTSDEFDGLVAAALKGTRGGKRVEAARRVMTKGVSCTDAANDAGITPSSVTQLVLQLEKYHAQTRSKEHKEYTEDLLAKIAIKESTKPKTPDGPARMGLEEFKKYIDLVPREMKQNWADQGARLVLMNNTPLPEIARAYKGVDLVLTQDVVAKIRDMKAQDEADLINDFE